MADYLDYSRILEATEPSGHGNVCFLGFGFEMGSAAANADEGRWGRDALSLLISASLSFSSSRALLISFSSLPSTASAEPLFVEAPRGAPCLGWRGGRCCAVVVGGAWRAASIARGRVRGCG
jgi:hypothetical protein